MANKIILKKSSVVGKVPAAGDLEIGELAVNLADEKLYSKNASGTVIQLGGGGGSGDVVGPSSATDNALARFDGATGKLIQNSIATLDDSGNMDTVTSKADAFDIDTTATPAAAVGRLSWDDGNGTAQLGMKGGNVTLQIGEELLARVYNDSGVALTDGQIVYISGAQGNRIAVKLAKADSEATSAGTLGMVTEPIAIGAEGFITVVGAVNKLDTSALTAGALVYLSATTAGAYTTTPPTAPNHRVTLGYVERVHATVGSIYIKVDNGYELDELHNVLITSPTSGNTLIYDASAGVWKNANLTDGTGITITEGAGSITIANSGVTSLTGTTNEIDVSASTGAITLSLPATINADTTGNAATATSAGKWTTARTLSFTGDATGSGSVDGSANVATALTLANTAVTAGSYTNTALTVDSKGRITAASSGTAPVTSVGATAPIQSSGGTAPTISITQASSTTNGYLSSTDWNTFNNKTSNTGTVTSVSGTGTVSGLSLSGTVTTSGNITLGGTLAVTPSNFASQTANTVLAAPNGTAGIPTFRTLVAADIPTLNQNTTGTASNVTGTVAIANGGTGATSAAAALTNLGAYPSSNPNGYTNNTGTVTNVATGTGLSGGPITSTGTISLANTTVTAGSYTLASITVDAQGRITAASNGTAAGFDAGTVMLFRQTAAPTGWTKDVTNFNDSALRVVTGTVASGGTVGFTTAFASQAVAGTIANTTATGTLSGGAVAATTLATAQIPAHNHSMGPSGAPFCGGLLGGSNGGGTAFTGNTGGGGSHTHTFTQPTFTGTAHNHTFTGTAINLAVKYCDVIFATKN